MAHSKTFRAFLAFLLAPIAAYVERFFVLSMADTAFQTQYRQEFIAGFEQHVSLLRETVTTEAVIKGNTAVFLVADSGSATAVTRGVNGLIPARSDNMTQNSATLGEWHDLVRKDGFNIFASQGNQRAIMQMTSMGVVNRKIDSQIIDELNTGTVTIGATGASYNVSLFQNGRVKLSNASVPWDSRITLLCNPAFLAYLEQAPEFAKATYVDLKPYAGDDMSGATSHRPTSGETRSSSSTRACRARAPRPRSTSCTTRPPSGTPPTRAALRRRPGTTKNRTTAGRAPRSSWRRSCCRTPASLSSPRTARPTRNPMAC